MFKNIKLGYTVAMMPVLASIGFVLIILQSIWKGSENQDYLTRIETGYFPSLELSRDLEDMLLQIQRGLQDAAAAADEDGLQRTDELRDKFLARLEDAKDNPVREKHDVETLATKFKDYYALAVKVTRRLIAVEKAGQGGQVEEGPVEEEEQEDSTYMLESMQVQYNSIREELENTTTREREEMASAFLSAHDNLTSSTRMAVWVTGIFLTLLWLLSLYILLGTVKASRTLKDMTELGRSLASGDLSLPALKLDGTNEFAKLGQSVDQMADALRTQVGAIKQASSTVMKNASEVTSATSQLSAAASEQASSIAETTSTVEELKQAGLATKSSAGQIVETSEKSVEVSGEGLQAVEASTTEMGRIREQVETIAAGIEGLRTQVGEVDEIITLVNQVAEQSNLLAVNASIEAAKAGESGRGFAVVAQEVKSLATQSKQATTQVRKTLGNIQNAIEGAFASARAGREYTEAGVSGIEHTGEVIRNLSGMISNAAELAKRIAINANEQVVGLEQVALAMSNVNQAASENLASTQQLEKGSEKLTSMAGQLEQLVNRYKLAD